jgi:membrane-bound lytic murein transglycosylase D
LQELACDAAVVKRGRADAHAYGRMLLESASLEGRWRFVPEGARAATGPSAVVLRRRIAMLMSRTKAPKHFSSHTLAALACGLVLAVTAIAARAAMPELKLSAADVQPLAESLARKGVTVPVNDIVLIELNTLVGTREWNAFLRQARGRMDGHRPMVEKTFARYYVPPVLMAVAVMESGFRSLEPRTSFRAAGVWQMIPQTARSYGLRVEPGRDERLDLERETDAAARLLGALHLQFQDWPLALAAYNQGPSLVLKATEEGMTRDAWELIRTERLNRYAATVVAAALVLEDADRILNNPPAR